tara:strand:- start:6717 stop:6989 length:273 start_codon:yes stop_codon:yes gene_type:complete
MSSLLNKLESGQASNQSFNGQTPTTPDFQQSTLHNEYSINGDPLNNGRFIPAPSQLDINGVVPRTALNDPSYGSMNDTFKNGSYQNNLPQ